MKYRFSTAYTVSWFYYFNIFGRIPSGYDG